MSDDVEAQKRSAVAEAFKSLAGISPDRFNEVETAIDRVMQAARAAPDPGFHCGDQHAIDEVEAALKAALRLRKLLTELHGMVGTEMTVSASCRFLHLCKDFDRDLANDRSFEPITVYVSTDALRSLEAVWTYPVNRCQVISAILNDAMRTNVDSQLARVCDDLQSAKRVFASGKNLFVRPSSTAAKVMDSVAFWYERLTGKRASQTKDVRTKDEGGLGSTGVFYTFASRIFETLEIKASVEDRIRKTRPRRTSRNA